MQLINIAALFFLAAGIVQAGEKPRPPRPPLDPGLNPTKPPQRLLHLRSGSKLRERDGVEAAPVAVAAAEDK